MTTVSPETVNTSGVVGQATSFDLTLTGGSPYTYTQTFGNICDVSINNDTATVTITPTTSGTLTGSITFDNQATCNITINVSEPQPQTGLQPTTVTRTLTAEDDSSVVEFELLSGSYDSSTENVEYNYNTSGDITANSLSITDNILYNGYELTLTSHNPYADDIYGSISVYAKIYDLHSSQLLRTYTATINLTIQGLDSEP